MGLFSKKSKEEKTQAKEEKKLAKVEAKEEKKLAKVEVKEAKKAESNAFNQIMKDKGVKKVFNFSLTEDTMEIFTPLTAVTLYLLKDDSILVNGLIPGQFSAKKDLGLYNLIEVEWLEDIKNKGKKVVGRSIAGAMIAGPAGMIIGGLTGKDKIKDKSVAVITLQDQDTHNVRMFTFKCEAKDVNKYKLLPKKPLIEDETVVEAPPVDSLEQLKKLKELLDLEAITQEEFDLKKKELLSI